MQNKIQIQTNPLKLEISTFLDIEIRNVQIGLQCSVCLYS